MRNKFDFTLTSTWYRQTEVAQSLEKPKFYGRCSAKEAEMSLADSHRAGFDLKPKPWPERQAARATKRLGLANEEGTLQEVMYLYVLDNNRM